MTVAVAPPAYAVPAQAPRIGLQSHAGAVAPQAGAGPVKQKSSMRGKLEHELLVAPTTQSPQEGWAAQTAPRREVVLDCDRSTPSQS